MCKHRNITFIEIGRTQLEWNIEDGKATGSNQRAGDLDRVIYVKCSDCPLERHYFRSTAPEWVRRYIRYINSGQASEDIVTFEKEQERKRIRRFS